MEHIVVLGAGYAGLIAANKVAKRTKGKAVVTLINARDTFVERVRLHQLAAGEQLRERPLAAMVKGRGIRLIIDRVTGIDTASRRLALAGGTEIEPYDSLVYALGSGTDRRGVAGVDEHAFDVGDAASARRLRERIGAASVVAVVGGGLTGLEVATELAERFPELKVKLVTSGVLGAALSERGRKHLGVVFIRLGIEVVDEVSVAEVRSDGVLLAGGDHVAADTVVWTAGFRVPELARDAGIETDAHGRILVDTTMRSVADPHIYGIGDAAAARMATGQELRMSCAAGMPTAQTAAEAIAVRLAGEQPEELRFRYLQQNISLGRKDALIQFVQRDDTPVERVLTGRIGALYKEIVCKFAATVQKYPNVPTAF